MVSHFRERAESESDSIDSRLSLRFSAITSSAISVEKSAVSRLLEPLQQVVRGRFQSAQGKYESEQRLIDASGELSCAGLNQLSTDCFNIAIKNTSSPFSTSSQAEAFEAEIIKATRFRVCLFSPLRMNGRAA